MLKSDNSILLDVPYIPFGRCELQSPEGNIVCDASLGRWVLRGGGPARDELIPLPHPLRTKLLERGGER